MSRQDGDEVWCGGKDPHDPHVFTSWEGVDLRCPGRQLHHAPAEPKEERYIVEITRHGVTVFWKSEDPEYDGNDAAILWRNGAIADVLATALTKIKYLGER